MRQALSSQFFKCVLFIRTFVNRGRQTLDLQFKRSKEGEIPGIRRATCPHRKTSRDTLVQRTGGCQTLESTLREVNVVGTATFTVINDANLRAPLGLLIAETDKVTTRRAIFPSLHHSTNVVVVTRAPVTGTTSRVLQVVRSVPSDLDTLLPNLLEIIWTVCEGVDTSQSDVALVHTKARLAANVDRAFVLGFFVPVWVTARVNELDLIAAIVEKLFFICTSHSYKSDQRKNNTQSKLEITSHGDR